MKDIISEKKFCILRVTAFAVALIFIAIGIIREEYLVVLKKAVNICLECIGIG